MEKDNVKIKNEYLANLANGTWKMEEFNKECAYWFIDCEDLKPLCFPQRPQVLIDEYDALRPESRKALPEKFWRQDEVVKYLDYKQFVKDRNRGILAKLKEFRDYIPEADTVIRTKFDSFIALYSVQKVIPDTVRKAMKTFRGGLVE